MITIYIPIGLPDSIICKDAIVPDGCDIELNNTHYADGHREGVLYTPDGKSYSIEMH